LVSASQFKQSAAELFQNRQTIERFPF